MDKKSTPINVVIQTLSAESSATGVGIAHAEHVTVNNVRKSQVLIMLFFAPALALIATGVALMASPARQLCEIILPADVLPGSEQPAKIVLSTGQAMELTVKGQKLNFDCAKSNLAGSLFVYTVDDRQLKWNDVRIQAGKDLDLQYTVPVEVVDSTNPPSRLASAEFVGQKNAGYYFDDQLDPPDDLTASCDPMPMPNGAFHEDFSTDTESNRISRVSCLRESCLSGLGAACTQTGLLIENDVHPIKVFDWMGGESAADYFERGCVLLDSWSCFNLAVSMQFSGVRSQNYRRSKLLLEKACGLGNARACNFRGANAENAQRGACGDMEDLDVARYWYRRSCDLSDPIGSFKGCGNLARMNIEECYARELTVFGGVTPKNCDVDLLLRTRSLLQGACNAATSDECNNRLFGKSYRDVCAMVASRSCVVLSWLLSRGPEDMRDVVRARDVLVRPCAWYESACHPVFDEEFFNRKIGDSLDCLEDGVTPGEVDTARAEADYRVVPRSVASPE